MAKVNPDVRRKVYQRDRFCCRYCGRPVLFGEPDADNAATLDHVVPRSQGGRSIATNLKTACRACNQAKESMSLADYRAAGMPDARVRAATALKRGSR